MHMTTPDTSQVPTQDKHLDAWLEVCRIAQGKPTKLNVTTPHTWKQTALNPIESPRHRHLQGQKVTLKPAHDQGQPRTGRILLVTESPEHKEPRAFIHLDNKPEPEKICTQCKKETPRQNITNTKSRACAECNQVYHKSCLPKEHKPDHFPTHDWFCHRCLTVRKTPKGLLTMNITTARQAIKRHNTYVANAHQEENKKQMKHLKDIQATCPTTEIIAIISSNDLIRTIKNKDFLMGPGYRTRKNSSRTNPQRQSLCGN
jgi:hypothetical protein